MKLNKNIISFGLIGILSQNITGVFAVEKKEPFKGIIQYTYTNKEFDKKQRLIKDGYKKIKIDKNDQIILSEKISDNEENPFSLVFSNSDENIEKLMPEIKTGKKKTDEQKKKITEETRKILEKYKKEIDKSLKQLEIDVTLDGKVLKSNKYIVRNEYELFFRTVLSSSIVETGKGFSHESLITDKKLEEEINKVFGEPVPFEPFTFAIPKDSKGKKLEIKIKNTNKDIKSFDLYISEENIKNEAKETVSVMIEK